MVDKSADAFLAHNVKGLMMDLISRWNRTMDTAQAETEFASVRPADQRLFGHMRGRPTPLSEFHTGLGISRQAVHKSVSRLQDLGLVQVGPMPGSARDKLVEVTDKGQRLRAFAAAQIRGIEEDCRSVLGDEGLETFRSLLLQLCEEGSGPPKDT